MDISKLKVPDLKRELKARGLSTTGNKNELIERLQSAVQAKLNDVVSNVSVDDLEEDLLNEDDDDVHLDTSESVMQELDSALDETSTASKRQKRKLETGLNADQNKTDAPKKIVLNRNPSTSSDTTQNGSANDATENKTDNNTDKKVIKLSELSVKERLEMRAKKFGVQLSVDAKKAARSERFGTAATATTGIKSTPNLDMLQRRAERFGASVAPALSQLEKQQQLEKRKERFGIVASANGSVSQSDKAKQRLERFKQPVK